MTIFYIALAIGLIVAVAYVGLAVEAFVRVRREALAEARPIGDKVPAHAGPAAQDPADKDVYAGQGRNFTWKAISGVAASTLVLVLVSATPTAWDLLPVLAIGSSAAVVTAFIVDRKTGS
jgi:hypothetical protein